MTWRSLGLGVLLALGGLACGNEYVCPDPIGRIVRDDCASYQTRYDSLKVELGFSLGHLGVSLAAGREKLRDPSELLQLVLQQTLALCKDFNTCRVPPADYQRRREEADQRFTAIAAISQQLQSTLDEESKRKLVTKLIDVISLAPVPRGTPLREPGHRPAPRFSPGFFRDVTSLWFGSRFLPPPSAKALPRVARWEITHARGIGPTSSYVHLTLWGQAEADDRIYLALSTPPLQANEKVRPQRGEPRASASFHFADTLLQRRGTLSLWYRRGSTGEKLALGSASLDVQAELGRGYLAYLPDPVRLDPIDYERPWLVFNTRVEEKTRVAVRCEHEGKPLDAVLLGYADASPYDAGHLRRHYVPLPVRIPLHGGSERRSWDPSVPGERPVEDLWPREAAGPWRCQASLNGRVARRFSFELRADGSAIAQLADGPLVPPWWPIKTERVANELERERDRQLAEEDAQEETRERQRRAP